ncbi:hypothetical protein dsx2_2521 [Desulfovibrio sp. X2]|uniref:hypothetical protein n=1 Tax=Desulfovibrio sp. X2 TaxID=941449 RepID=UPI000358D69D|nr:hypothetical protein [Desulfovibrio sp. X2]EPR43161.1 hypothetical protein dsx2_2521 [Desulfovibrio sp. X2]
MNGFDVWSDELVFPGGPRARKSEVLPGFCHACPEEDGCGRDGGDACRFALAHVRKRHALRGVAREARA